jgi:hypothetical protein
MVVQGTVMMVATVETIMEALVAMAVMVTTGTETMIPLRKWFPTKTFRMARIPMRTTISMCLR